MKLIKTNGICRFWPSVAKYGIYVLRTCATKWNIQYYKETNNLNEYAKKKLSEKNCDWIIANDISNPSIGFGSDYNKVSIFYKNSKFEKLPKMKKSLLVDNIVKKIISQLN